MSSPTPERISPTELAAYQAARARAQLAQAHATLAAREVEVLALRLFVAHRLGPADQIDEATGDIRRAAEQPHVDGDVRALTSMSPSAPDVASG